jgi:hypothetical protein
MQTITKRIALIVLVLTVQLSNAQEINNSEQVKNLKEQKELILTEEREYLKQEVENINQRLTDGDLTKDEADKLKLEVAEKRALNIENRTTILENKIALLSRNEQGYKANDGEESLAGISVSEKGSLIGIKIRGKNKPKKYDRRTTSDLVFAIGLNNAITDGKKLDDSPYKIGGSRFLELGIAWKTRVFKESNFVRLKYGFSFQMNGLKPENNQYFVMNGDETSLEEFPYDLSKSKLLITNLVFPVHFEFGPSKKIEHKDHFRYSTNNKFKIGIGGYAGFNIGTRQKLKYTVDGDKVKDRIKRDYNTSKLVYGLSSYISFDDVALYAKYDLSPLFKDQVVDQNNISLGLRFDMD